MGNRKGFGIVDKKSLGNLESRQTLVVATGGERFCDGSVLELVRNNATSAVELFHWKDGKSAITAHFLWEGERYVPADDAAHLKHLPSEANLYPSTRDLFEEVRAFIVLGLNLSIESATLLTHFCIASFFADVLPICPFLTLSGDSMGATSVLRLLGCVTRHPLLLADCGMYCTARELRPTRLILQADSRVDALLAPLQFPGFAISDRGLRQISGAVAVYVGDFELRSQHLEAGLWFPVPPTLRFFSPQDELRNVPKITELQNRLLQYRMQNLNAVASSDFDVPNLSGSSRVIAQMFGQCIVDAPDCQAQVAQLLKARDEESRVERSSKLNAVIIEALVVLCHEQKPSVHLGEVAKITNAILTRSQEVLNLSPRKVGAMMKKMGLVSGRLDAAGRGIYLLREQCALIHRLGSHFGVPSLVQGLPGCPHCQDR